MTGVSSRIIRWFFVLALILSFGWYKSYENRADRERRAAWDQGMRRLQAESHEEFNRLVSWLNGLHSQADARQQVQRELSGGHALKFENDGAWEVTSWTHPKYGIRLSMDFAGEKLVSHGVSGGTADLLAMHPMPESIATTSRAEAVREFVVAWGPWLWLVLLLIALASRSYGLAAAEMAVAAALACGTAWAVSPHYTLTLRGIFSNDRLFFAALMYLGSLIVLAMRFAPMVTRAERPHGIQFSLRTLLAIMSLTAVLLAIGPLGYLAICVFGVGGLFSLVVWHVSLSVRQSSWAP